MNEETIVNVEEEEDDLLSGSESGGLLRVSGGFFWGVIRAVLILAVVGLLFWIIWKPAGQISLTGGNLDTNTTPIISLEDESGLFENLWDKIAFWKSNEGDSGNVVVEVEKEVPVTQTNDEREGAFDQFFGNVSDFFTPKPDNTADLPIGGRLSGLTGVGLPASSFENGSVLGKSIAVLREGEVFFRTPLIRYVEGESQGERAAKISALNVYLNDSITSISTLQQGLADEFTAFSAQTQQQIGVSAQAQADVNTALAGGTGVAVEKAVEVYAKAQSLISGSKAKAEIRRVTSQKLQNIKNSMAVVQQNLLANRIALENDVRVVNFQQDLFGRVLTPAQWRSLGN